jgi:hypothetical protein
MFERYTEQARRIVFFGRFEASRRPNGYIEPEHLLLALCREDPRLKQRLPEGALEEIERQVDSQFPSRTPLAPSQDIPLSQAAKRVLHSAMDEAAKLDSHAIDTPHLVLGLLTMGGAASMLQPYGIGYLSYREDLKRTSPPPSFPTIELHTQQPAAPSLKDSIDALDELLEQTRRHLEQGSERYGDQRLKRKPWTRREAFGHLIDYATAHHQWFARALTEPKVQAAAYPSEDRVTAQAYRYLSWDEVVDLWVRLNRLLLHVLKQIPENKVSTPCRIGLDEAVPLSELVRRYVEHCGDITGQILARL